MLAPPSARRVRVRTAGPIRLLVVDGFDIEQVWAELQIENETIEAVLSRRVERLSRQAAEVPTADQVLDAADGECADDAHEDALDAGSLAGESVEQRSSDGHGGSRGGSGSGDDDAEKATRAFFSRTSDPSVRTDGAQKADSGHADGDTGTVEDRFFRLDEMRQFVEDAERHADAADSDDGSDDGDVDGEDAVDYFTDPGSATDTSEGAYESSGTSRNRRKSARAGESRSARELHYADFFDEPTAATTATADQPADGAAHLSTFERKQRDMQRRIEALEERNLAERPWQLRGEVRAQARPRDSLLEEVLEFERASAPPPVVTAETTEALESVILQRIHDRLFDDPVPCTAAPSAKSTEQPIKPPRLEDTVEQTKSKQGLGEIYAQEYLRTAHDVRPPCAASVRTSARPRPDAARCGPTYGPIPGAMPDACQLPSATEQKTAAAHREIRALFEALCHRLDALSNLHYTPKAPLQEAEVVVQVRRCAGGAAGPSDRRGWRRCSPACCPTRMAHAAVRRASHACGRAYACGQAPAISMEEAIPTHVADAQRLAPEEVYARPPDGVVKARRRRAALCRVPPACRAAADGCERRRRRRGVVPISGVHAGATSVGRNNGRGKRRPLQLGRTRVRPKSRADGASAAWSSQAAVKAALRPRRAMTSGTTCRARASLPASSSSSSSSRRHVRAALLRGSPNGHNTAGRRRCSSCDRGRHGA